MRRVSITVLAALLTTTATAQTPATKTDRCAPTAGTVAGSKPPAGAHRLGDEPPAAQILTVYRTDADGCPTPVVLRKGVGANPEKAMPLSRSGGRLHRLR